MAIATEVESAINSLLTDYVVDTSTRVIALLAPLALTAITIYLISMGWAIARGDTNDSLGTFVSKSFRIAFITGLALSVGAYQSTVVEFIEGIQVALISAFTPAGTVGAMIDEMAEPYDVLGQQLWNDAVTGVIPNLSLAFAAGLVALAQGFLFVVGLGLFLLAKVTLALVLAVGPVFIFLAIFPATQKYTESWLAQALTFVMLNVLIAGSIGMLTRFASQYAEHIASGPPTINIVRAAMALLLCSCALGVVMLNHSALASALSGGMTLSGIGREVGRGLMRGAGRKASPPSGNEGGGSLTQVGAASRSSRSMPQSDSTGVSSQPLYQRNVMDNIRRSSSR